MKTDMEPSTLPRNHATGAWVKYTVLLFLGAIWLLPFYWMATSAVKNDQQVFVVPPVWVPNPPRWENMAEAWGAQNFNLFLFNTIIKYAIPVTIGTVLSSAIVAYGFARIKWLG